MTETGGFAVVFEIVPSSPFGVPEEGMTVFKAQEGTFYSDTFHASGVRVALGQLSEYRSPSDAINMRFELSGLPATITDNFLRLEVQAESHSDALAAARTVVDRFAQHLGIAGSRWSAAVPLLVEGPDSDDRPVGTSFVMSRVATYNLDDLKLQIADAVAAANIKDERLAIAIRYFQHAMWLFGQRAAIGDPFDSNASMLVSSIMLNMWKAASAIVGDPTTDKDYQSRYRRLGFDLAFFTGRIEPIRAHRNDSDVAHYSLDPSTVERLMVAFPDAASTVAELVTAETTRLREAETSPG